MQKEENEFQFTMEDICCFNLFNKQDNSTINNTKINIHYQNVTQSRFAETIEDSDNDSIHSSNLSQEKEELNLSFSSNDELFNKLSSHEQDYHKVIL